MITFAFIAIRGVQVLQGLVCVMSGWRAYRRPAVAALVEAGAIVELGAVATHCVRAGRIDAPVARVDAAFGLAGLAALALATEPADRTTSLNWMLPLTVGSTLGAASLETQSEGAAIATALGVTYAATNADAIRARGGRTATAVANALSYPGFFVVAALVTRFARRLGSELDDARHQAVEQGARLAAEAATNREHRLLHDSALQTLEAIAAGTAGTDQDVRRHAEREAAVLRQALRHDRPVRYGMLDRLARLIGEFAEKGLRVELVSDELDREPATIAADALCEAVREALANVLKHSGVDRATVRISDDREAWIITVRDAGKGFDSASTPRGFGLDNSITSRLKEVGGWSSVRSSPGDGTKVEVGVPF